MYCLVCLKQIFYEHSSPPAQLPLVFEINLLYVLLWFVAAKSTW